MQIEEEHANQVSSYQISVLDWESPNPGPDYWKEVAKEAALERERQHSDVDGQ